MKIKLSQIGNQNYYSIIDQQFQCLTDLVDYYRHNPISIVETNKKINLGVGVHKKTVSIYEDWYAPEFCRETGFKELNKYKQNGSFFIRSSETDYVPNENKPEQFHAYTLTFYMDDQVFYSRIFVKIEDYEITYFINEKAFQSLKELVDYHRNFPVHKKQTLVKGVRSLSKKDSFLFNPSQVSTPKVDDTLASIINETSYVNIEFKMEF